MNPSIHHVTLREAGPEDAEAIVHVYVDSANVGYEGREPWRYADPARIARWRHDLSSATPTRWWIAEEDHHAVGVVGIGPSRDPVEMGLGEVDTIAVMPNAWRRGIGKVLMAHALSELKEGGYRRAILWTHANYPLAERFYVSTGWTLSGYTRQNGLHVRYDHPL